MMNKLMIMAMVIGFFIVGMEICTLKADEVALEEMPAVQVGLRKESWKLREKKLCEGLKKGFVNVKHRPVHLWWNGKSEERSEERIKGWSEGWSKERIVRQSEERVETWASEGDAL